MNESFYEVGKDIQSLKDRIEKLESANKEISKKIKRKGDGEPCCKEEYFKFSKRGTFTDEKGIEQRYIEANLERLAAGDCVISWESVTIYENGFYSDIARLIDRGLFQGDRFRVTVTAYSGEQAIASWSWDEWVDAGDEEDHDTSGTDARLASRFDDIDAIGRLLTCD